MGAPPRPDSATAEEWAAFDRNQRENFPWQERIEDALSTIQDIVLFPSDVIHTVRCYYRNRFVDKLHVLETGLKPGQYYEYEARLLHGMFNSFVQYIEEELTVKTLLWEMSLTHDFEWLPDEEAKTQPEYGKPTPQAIAAQEQHALYTWWKVARPARQEPYEASGYAEWMRGRERTEGDNFWDMFTKDAHDVDRKALSDRWHEIEEQYNKEDEDMMIRLVRIRQSLWT